MNRNRHLIELVEAAYIIALLMFAFAMVGHIFGAIKTIDGTYLICVSIGLMHLCERRMDEYKAETKVQRGG